jgi:hypothetical protein
VAGVDYTPNTAGCTITGAKTADVTFVGGAAARIVCYLNVGGADHFAIKGNSNSDRIEVQRIITGVSNTNNVTIQYVDMTCADSAPWILEPPNNKCTSNAQWSGSSWTVSDSSIGPTYDSSLCGGGGDASKLPIQYSTLTRVTFHDARYPASCGSGQHTENIYLTGMSNTVWDNVTITNGANSGKVTGTGSPDGTGPNTGALFFTRTSSQPHDDTIQNMLITGPGCNVDGSNDAQMVNMILINNTFPCGITATCTSANCPGGYTSYIFRNNIVGMTGNCPDAASTGSAGGVRYDHNIWVYTGSGGSQDKCGATDLTTANTLGIVTAWGGDYHLIPAAAE